MATKVRKLGRNTKRPHNTMYKNERRHEKSHVRRIVKHLKRHPADKVAVHWLGEYRVRAGIQA